MVKNAVTIKNARIIFRDFTGEKNRFNDDRTFCVVLEDELAEQMKADGWNVKHLEPRNEDETGLYFISVKVDFESKYPPQVIKVENGHKQELDEDTISILNYARFKKVDVRFRPYNYEVRGSAGVKAYLSSLWVTVEEDELEAMYRDIPYASDKEYDRGNEGVSEEEGLPFN